MDQILYQAEVSQIIFTRRQEETHWLRANKVFYVSRAYDPGQKKTVSVTLEDHGSGEEAWYLRFLGEPVSEAWVEEQYRKKRIAQGAKKAAGVVAAGAVGAAAIAKECLFPGSSNAAFARRMQNTMKDVYEDISGSGEAEAFRERCRTYVHGGRRERYDVHSPYDIHVHGNIWGAPLYFRRQAVSANCTIAAKEDRCVTFFFDEHTAFRGESLTLEFRTPADAVQLSEVLRKYFPLK